MFCEKCGALLQQDDAFCPNCGVKVSVHPENPSIPKVPPPSVPTKKANAQVPPFSTTDTSVASGASAYVSPSPSQRTTKKKKKNKPSKPKMSKGKKAGIICLIILTSLVILTGTMAVLFFTGPVVKIDHFMQSEQYAEALYEYQSNVRGDIIQESLLEVLLKNRTDETIVRFKSGEMSYDATVEALNTLEEMGFEKSRDRIPEITASQESKQSLSAGDQFYETGEYGKAIEEYSKIPEDDENFETAQSKLKELYPKYIDSVIATVQSYNASKQYQEAISYVNTAYDLLPDSVDTSKLESAKAESLYEYKSNILNESTELINDAKYIEALTLLDKALTVDDNGDFHNMRTTVEDKYVASVTDTVQKHLDDEDYISAARVVNNALTVLPNNAELNALKQSVSDATPIYLLTVCKPYESSCYEEYINGEKFKMGGKEYTNGFTLATDYSAYAIFNLNSQYSSISFDLGHVDESGMNTSTIKIYCDDVLNIEYEVSGGSLPQRLTLDVTGVNQFKITVENFSAASYGFGNVTVK